MRSFVVISLAALVAYTIACTCKTKTLEEMYCESDYVARVLITGFGPGPNANYTSYTFSTVRNFKINNDTNVDPTAAAYSQFITPSTSATCEIQWLSPGREYVINTEETPANALYTNICLQFPLTNQSSEYTDALTQKVQTFSQDPTICQ
ncbi:unnamed protein product [Bursaphelenchus xylophilus]|uniref:(pine wood nematode) hypothetical protein n=1 Tax=Bursaphelenchus xylophilus TaxID=6326 RepID=A0A1I7SUS7_BURXY|nr:unnamed protein product [Bursaphelenchus xylophilus]CAG9125899.1 unnamed protein product [Bursaphelenchus xylophilus]